MHYTSPPGRIACLILQRESERKLRKAFVEISRTPKHRLIEVPAKTGDRLAKPL
jgi:hypothetical protein